MFILIYEDKMKYKQYKYSWIEWKVRKQAEYLWALNNDSFSRRPNCPREEARKLIADMHEVYSDDVFIWAYDSDTEKITYELLSGPIMETSIPELLEKE